MNKAEGFTRMTSLNQDTLLSQKNLECQHIRTLGSLDAVDEQNNNKPAYSLEMLPYAKTQHQLAQVNSPQNQRTNKDEQVLQICQIQQESSSSSSYGSSSNRSSDRDSFSQKVASVDQLNSPYQSKPFIDEKWNPLGWVKESLQKPISKNKAETKIQYFISSNNEHKRKHRLLSLHTAESGAFKELVTFIDKVDKLEEVNLHKLKRKQSCCCERCGQKTKKQKKIDMVLPQFKPKQAIRRMHRNNFQKIITDVNKISQFFRSKLQLHQKNNINYQGIRGKSNSHSKIQHSNTIKLSSRSPLKRQSFSREVGSQSSHNEPVSADLFQTSPLGNFTRDQKTHFTTFKPRESQKFQSHTLHTNFSLQVSPETSNSQTLIQSTIPDKRISNFSPEMIRSQKSYKSRFIPTQFASRASKCTFESQDQQQKKQIPERSKLETAIMKQFKEETNMKHINTDFVLSVGNNILKESLQNLPKDGDDEPLSFPEIPAINTEPIVEDIKDDVFIPQLSQKNKISSFKHIYAQNNNISNYCKGNAPKLKTCFLYPLIKTKQEQYPMSSQNHNNNTSDSYISKHNRVKSDISYKTHLTTSQIELDEDKPNVHKKLLKKKNQHNSSTASTSDQDKNLSSQSSQTSTWKFYSPEHSRNPISSFYIAGAGNSFIDNLAQKVKAKKKQKLPSITSCSQIDNIYLRTNQYPQPNPPSYSKKNSSNNRPPFTTFGINNQILPTNSVNSGKQPKLETIIPIPKRLKKDLSLQYFISATQNSKTNINNNSCKSDLQKTFQIPKIQQSLANQFSNIYFSKTNLFQNKSVYLAAGSASNLNSPHIPSKQLQN